MSDFDFTTGTITDNGSLVVFDFEGISKKENIQVTGKMEFSFEKDICTGCKQAVTFPSEALAQAAYQESLATAEEVGVTDLKISGNTVSCSTQDLVGVSRIVVKCWLKYLIEEEEIGYGTLESPFSPIIANIFVGGSLQSGETTTEDYYVKGIISNIKYTFNEQYGTATFFISKDGQNDYTFQCYSVFFLGNKSWVEGNTQIKLGDEVIVCGKLTNYQGTTPETASKKAYIYSLNGVTASVNDIKAAQQKAVIYNLAGQRLEKAQKGLNIINGKKVMVK